MSKIGTIGIIAEDDSDFKVIKTIIQKEVNKTNIKFKKNISHGCGKLKRKCKDYIDDLFKRQCDLVLVFHDLDKENELALETLLLSKIKGCKNNANVFLTIPKEEIEAWFLSDPESIKKTFKIRKKVSVKGHPETIQSPKEFLRDLIYINSNKTSIYNNTMHNEKIAENLDITLVKTKCISYQKLADFLNKHSYN